MDDRDGRPVKVKVMDKRRVAAEAEATGPAHPQPPEPGPADAAQETEMEQAQQEAARAESELLDDLRRLQADFDNYRKRMLREQTAMASRASARLVERLLPVLDNFERAIEHGEGGPGIELVHRELRQTLEQEGLAEIAADGERFDPRLHEAFQVTDDVEVAEPVVRSVYRRGYRLGDQVLRPAMVVVARPPEAEAAPAEDDGVEVAPEEREG